MQHSHTDMSFGFSAALGGVALTVLLAAEVWVGVSFVSLVGVTLASALRGMPGGF
jgi:hypothetical protein